MDTLGAELEVVSTRLEEQGPARIIRMPHMYKDLREIFSAGLTAADPEKAIRNYLRLEGNKVLVAEEELEAERIFILAAGKAAGAMSRAAEELLGERVKGGVLVTKDDHDGGSGNLEVFFASHPEPDQRGVEAARRAEELVMSLGEGDLLLALISGGASALLADPAPPVGIEDLEQLTGELLKSGAAIGEINTVRKHVSALKGGRLVQGAAPAKVLALLLSDVVGDEPSSIASGPTVPDPTKLDDAKKVLQRYGIDPPQSVKDLLEVSGETPKPGDPIFEGVVNVVCGGGRHAVEAAARKAGDLGYEPLILSSLFTGDASAMASVYAAMIRESLATGNPLPPPCALVSGGEATVTVRGEGTGGPNQEFALALATELEGVAGWAAVAADTDGNDGSTDAAGGMVDGATAEAIREGGMDPTEALTNNDAHAALHSVGALLVTGPTGTNVNDLRVALVESPETKRRRKKSDEAREESLLASEQLLE